MKYELTTNTINDGAAILYQIKALKDFGNVKAGDLGGWVQSEDNLSQQSDAWVYDNARVYDNAWVYDNARVSGDAWVYDNARVYGTAWVSGDAQILVGAHSKSPLYIQGTKHSITVNTKDLICVGCKELSLAQWQEQFLQVGAQEGYSEEEIEEYERYLDLISEIFKETK